MKIGIMGGTFNPIHYGHLKIAETAERQFGLDEVWFLPNAHPPHKDPSRIMAAAWQRVEMVRLAIADIPKFQLELYEAEKESVSCSYATMEYMKQAYPANDFFFIIGADSLLMIDSWVKPERLLAACKILVAFRDGIDQAATVQDRIDALGGKYEKAEIFLLSSPLMPVSSSQIRLLCGQGKSIHGLVPDAVEQYIVRSGLYAGYPGGKAV